MSESELDTAVRVVRAFRNGKASAGAVQTALDGLSDEIVKCVADICRVKEYTLFAIRDYRKLL